HAQIQWDGHQLFLEDAGSSTGTYVNGEKITERRAIAEGDRIYLGPPGSGDSASLLVCPPADDPGAYAWGGDSGGGNELQLDAPGAPVLDAGEPLLLDPPSPSFDDSAPLSLDPPTLEPPPIPLLDPPTLEPPPRP